jgi:hypothetical protein
MRYEASNMNWEAIGAVGEIIGAVAVLLTLIYLAVQMRQNILLTKATIREYRTDSSQKVIMAFADIADLITKETDLSPGETLRVEMVQRSMFRDFEAYFYQRNAGLLDESERNAMQQTWRNILGSQKARDSWHELKLQYSTLLHDDLKWILEEGPTRP